MAIVGAFLGGTGGAIAAGYSELIINWQTTDGNNLSGVVFTLTGPSTYTLTTDSSGVARSLVKAGTYTVSVNVEGYTGTTPRTVICNSREVTSVVWVATKVYRQQVTILTPTSMILSYEIVNSDGDIEYSGYDKEWLSNMYFQLYPGEYTLNLIIDESSRSMKFDVGYDAIVLDTSPLFCKITVDFGFDYPVDINCEDRVYNSPFYLFKDNDSKTLIFSNEPKYSGSSSETLMSFQNVDITPSSDSLNVSPVGVGRILTLTADGNLSIPVKASFRILTIGGGGSGGTGTKSSNSSYPCGGGGGGSGNISESILELEPETYEIIIGKGGINESDSAGSSGSATSFGTMLSGSGGNGGGYGSYPYGGNGGSGGGGGGGKVGGTYGGSGGYGRYAGGGGGGGVDGYYYGGSGGSRGTYGGSGGSGGHGEKNSSNGAGGQVSSDEYYGTGTSEGGMGPGLSGGGGGGGGLNASGGNGGSGVAALYSGGGGGGGGIAGGNGGTGGRGYNASGGNGAGGRGYGAGGGGGYGYSNGGGGGGGGLGTVALATSGGSKGGKGADGAVRIQWVKA